ncbi:hypothetical protein GCM10007972_19170 [Iodidimonas muriae]|uniref:DUF4139 domain-containing protein n=2 Tax=Iodidimonas muriae TaxID=261467 RepID=A0ABQ2LG38_9PROT|nr:hypothetical protein GCM10007972_19170 [Iodidimonas muriae]
MGMKRSLLISVALTMLTPAVLANPDHRTIDADSRTDLSLTIYNNNLALVRDERDITVTSGQTQLEFSGISTQIQPQTVLFYGRDLQVMEQNFDANLLTPQSLLENAVGERVKIYRSHPETGEDKVLDARILSARGGVVLEVDGRIEFLNELPGRVVFQNIPNYLHVEPVLSLLINSKKSGDRTVALNYLSGGMSWSADYVGILSEDERSLDLQGWASIVNSSGVDFTEASIQLAAGEINRINRGNNVGRFLAAKTMESRAQMDMVQMEQSALADMHLYEVPQKTTLVDQQTKQIALIQKPKISARKTYRYVTSNFQSMDKAVSVDMALHFDNAKASGAGEPLPAGVLRIYTRDADGRLQFIGEDNLNHTPVDGEVVAQLGKAFDVTIQPTTVDHKVLENTRDRSVHSYTQRYLVKNRKDKAVTVEIDQKIYATGWKILKESQAHSEKTAQKILWKLDVPASGEAILEFMVEVEAR